MEKISVLFICLGFVFSCAPSNEFDQLAVSCDSTLKANATFSDVKDLYTGELLQIQEELIIEGYIISSDKQGNFLAP